MRTRPFFRFLALAPAIVVALVVVALRLSPRPAPSLAAAQPASPAALAASASGAPTVAASAAARGRAADRAAAPPSKPNLVTVGLYLHHVTQLDIRANTFLADFYVWFTWRGDVDPTKSFELRNAVEQWQIVKVPIYVDEAGAGQAITLPDGAKHQVFRIEARMGRPFSVKRYPLDEQDLTIEVEEAKYRANELVYEVDGEGTRVDKRLEIPGWEVAGVGLLADESVFETTFGEPRVKGGERYAHVELKVHLVRPTRGMIVKTIVPLAIVIFITFGVFLIDPHAIDARLTLAITALVSAIALHFTATTELPEVGYLMLLDKVYILSYLVILVTTFVSIFSSRLAEREKEALARRIDRYAFAGLVVAFVGGTLAILSS